MRQRALIGGMLLLLSVSGATPALALPPAEAVVLLHGELPGQTQCVILKRSAAPVLDRQTGSIVRGLAETMAHDAAVISAQLREVYESDFVGTASGTVSGGILDGGKFDIAEQWDVEIKAISGKPEVLATTLEQPVPVPSLADCA